MRLPLAVPAKALLEPSVDALQMPHPRILIRRQRLHGLLGQPVSECRIGHGSADVDPAHTDGGDRIVVLERSLKGLVSPSDPVQPLHPSDEFRHPLLPTDIIRFITRLGSPHGSSQTLIGLQIDYHRPSTRSSDRLSSALHTYHFAQTFAPPKCYRSKFQGHKPFWYPIQNRTGEPAHTSGHCPWQRAARREIQL